MPVYDDDRSSSGRSSEFSTPVASGTPLSSTAASANLIYGEKQSSNESKKELLNRFDAADESSFIDLSTVTVDTNSDTISGNSDSIYSITSTPEKLNISTSNSDTLEEIIIISSDGMYEWTTIYDMLSE